MRLPPARPDMPRELRAVAPWIPSHQLHEPIRAMLRDGSGLGAHAPAGIILVAIGGLAPLASHPLPKKRGPM